MSSLVWIADFARWVALVARLASGMDAPPRRALGLVEGAPMLLRRDGAGYAVARPARPGDRAPLLIGEDAALSGRLDAPALAAAQGPQALRFAAQAACPFPPADAALGVRLAAEPWRHGLAPCLTAAAPRRAVQAARVAVAAAGARPGRAFAMAAGAPVALDPPSRAILAPLAFGLALAALSGAHLWLGLRIAAVEDAAAARLSAARAALAAAEDVAARDGARAEAASAPLRMAVAAQALLAAAPPAAIALGRLAASVPDEAHAFRVAVSPGRIEAELAAPDAAALAALLAQAPGVARASLADGARVDPLTGLQRARLRLDLEPSG